MDLTDRTAIITGASSGIGAATARTLGDAGCNVVLAARREDPLHGVADTIDHEATRVVPTDVTDPDAVSTLIEETTDTFDGLDILVNNAGITRDGKLERVDIADLHAPVEVNLLGVMTTTHAAIPHLRDAPVGDLLTVSSMNAIHPAENGSGYTASKYGVNGFMDSIRQQVSDDDVRISTVMPGPVVTEMNDWGDWSGQALDPTDIAATIRFVLSRPDHVELPELCVNSTDKFD